MGILLNQKLTELIETHKCTKKDTKARDRFSTELYIVKNGWSRTQICHMESVEYAICLRKLCIVVTQIVREGGKGSAGETKRFCVGITCCLRSHFAAVTPKYVFYVFCIADVHTCR